MAGKGRRFVRTKEHAGVGDIGRGREGLGLGGAIDAAFERHQVEEVIGGGAGLVPAQAVHGGKDGADAFAGDRARKQQVDADTARPKLGRHLARHGVHRRLGHGIGSTRIIFGARKDRRDVDDRAALPHRIGGGADHVPGDDHDVARGITDSFAVGAAGGLQFGEIGLAERQVFERLLGAGRASVVDENVNMAVARNGFGNTGADAVGIGAIDNDGRGAAGIDADVGDGGIARCVGAAAVTPRKHHNCAFGEVTPGDRLAEITRRAGDQRDLAGEAPLRRNGHGRFCCRSFCHGRVSQFALSVGAAAAQASKSSSFERKPVAGSAWLTM